MELYTNLFGKFLIKPWKLIGPVLFMFCTNCATQNSKPVRIEFAKDLKSSEWGLLIKEKSRITLASEPGYEPKAATITWQPGDYVLGYRSELYEDAVVPNEVPVFYSFWFQIPENFNLKPQDSCVIMQFHTTDSTHKPQLAFRARGNKNLDVTLNHLIPEGKKDALLLQKKPLAMPNFPRGQWHLVEMYIRWSSKENGFIVININGKRKLSYLGQTNFSSQKTGPYFKYGVYPAKDLPYSLTVKYGPYQRWALPPNNFIEQKKLTPRPTDVPSRF